MKGAQQKDIHEATTCTHISKGERAKYRNPSRMTASLVPFGILYSLGFNASNDDDDGLICHMTERRNARMQMEVEIDIPTEIYIYIYRYALGVHMDLCVCSAIKSDKLYQT